MQFLKNMGKTQNPFPKEIKFSSLKACFVKRNILSTLVKEGEEMNVIKDKAPKPLNRTESSKINKDSNKKKH